MHLEVTQQPFSQPLLKLTLFLARILLVITPGPVSLSDQHAHVRLILILLDGKTVYDIQWNTVDIPDISKMVWHLRRRSLLGATTATAPPSLAQSVPATPMHLNKNTNMSADDAAVKVMVFGSNRRARIRKSTKHFFREEASWCCRPVS